MRRLEPVLRVHTVETKHFVMEQIMFGLSSLSLCVMKVVRLPFIFLFPPQPPIFTWILPTEPLWWTIIGNSTLSSIPSSRRFEHRTTQYRRYLFLYLNSIQQCKLQVSVCFVSVPDILCQHCLRSHAATSTSHPCLGQTHQGCSNIFPTASSCTPYCVNGYETVRVYFILLGEEALVTVKETSR